MANLSGHGVWTCDTVGIITENPIWITNALYIPAAISNAAVFRWYDVASPVAAGTAIHKTGTITLTNTLTSTGNLPSTIEDGFVFEITKSSGTSDNLGAKLVKTAGDANAVIIHEDDWTNEANKEYDWITYPSYTAIPLLTNDVTFRQMNIHFGDRGKRFPNLILESISGGTVYLYESRSG
jgi:hypothetical protein